MRSSVRISRAIDAIWWSHSVSRNMGTDWASPHNGFSYCDLRKAESELWKVSAKRSVSIDLQVGENPSYRHRRLSQDYRD